MKKVILSFLSVILTILLVFSFIFIFNYQKLNNNSGLKSFTVYYTDEDMDSINLLQEISREKYNFHISKFSFLSSKFKKNVFLFKSGYSQTLLYNQGVINFEDDVDFLLYREGNNILICGEDTDAKSRAVYYLLNNYVDEDHKVLLEDGEYFIQNKKAYYKQILIEDTPISSYVISYDRDSKAQGILLKNYILQCSGINLPLVENSEGPCILISSSLDKEVSFDGQNISIFKDSLDIFANMYLGYSFAGTDRQYFKKNTDVLNIRISEYMENPWIAKREPIITLWNTNYPRGIYMSEDTSLLTDVMSFSQDQLYSYVRMMKYCGYNGIQVTDMCSSWSGAGGYKNVQDKIRYLFDAAHSLGMKTTLWVWGAEFTGYGWTDDSVKYGSEKYEQVCMDPEVYDCFDKYYSIYAELADCTDRVIGHFYDPGNLEQAEDIAVFCKLLRSKFVSVNPNIDFGVSCWVDKFEKRDYVRILGNDITLYEGTQRYDEALYASFRKEIADYGTRLGTWSWNNCEMEIDQLAQMNYNADIIKETYLTARKYEDDCKPDYWSEMDSNHVVNVFSQYCAGKLLQNPDLDTRTLTLQIATATVGPENAEDFASVLELIQDARSGHSWDQYFWTGDDYILTSDTYPAEDINERSLKAMDFLDKLIDENPEASGLPLPITLKDLLKLLRSNVAQIQAYSKFRIEFDQLKADYANCDAPELIRSDLQTRLNDIYEPIPEYQLVVGTWGQTESRAMDILVNDFCDNSLLEMPIIPWYDELREDHIINWFKNNQRGKTEPVSFYGADYQYGKAYGEKDTERLINDMVERGILTRTDERIVILSDWKNYIYSK